jgi:hypothetical protein
MLRSMTIPSSGRGKSRVVPTAKILTTAAESRAVRNIEANDEIESRAISRGPSSGPQEQRKSDRRYFLHCTGVFFSQSRLRNLMMDDQRRLRPMPAERFAASRLTSSAHRRAPSVASAFAATLAATSFRSHFSSNTRADVTESRCRTRQLSGRFIHPKLDTTDDFVTEVPRCWPRL